MVPVAGEAVGDSGVGAVVLLLMLMPYQDLACSLGYEEFLEVCWGSGEGVNGNTTLRCNH